ncbi:MAG: DUF1002 domain-containing protein [Roseburia sp.]|nr:DUF1002 domain-containing protein [Roseburia sp.]
MRKEWKRMLCGALSACVLFTSAMPLKAAEVFEDEDAQETMAPGQTDADTLGDSFTTDASQGSQEDDGADASGEQTGDESQPGEANGVAGSDNTKGIDATATDDGNDSSQSENVSGTVIQETPDLSGTVTVEADKNDDNVKIKKNDRPYLALGADLSPEQRATVLALMGIDAGKLEEYDVLYVNNAEEHQYLDAYIDKSKIGTRSLSSIVIVERKDGNGINISTNNISYCTVGMYKNALATAGIEDADIIVAAPTAISGTAALVGIFKAYKEMTGDEIDEESIDTALHELVLTGNLESSNGADSDEVEALIAYVKQAVVEHDMSDEGEIREAIAEGCEKFHVVLTEEEINQIVELMQKINELDLDLDSLLNSAQSIYDKIKNGGDVSGFFSKLGNWFGSLIEKILNLFRK